MGDPLDALLRAARDARVNARFFPEDTAWQKHCARVATYLEAVSLKPEGKVS